MTPLTASCPAFAELAESLCATARVALPPITPDAAGGLGLRLEIDGVAVTVTHHPAQFPDHVFVLVAFGAVPASAEADVFRELLEANLMMLRPGAPSFGRDPLDGQIVLQACCAMHETGGNALFDGIRVAVGKALEWRRVNRLVSGPYEGAHGASHVPVGAFA